MQLLGLRAGAVVWCWSTQEEKGELDSCQAVIPCRQAVVLQARHPVEISYEGQGT